MPSKYPFEDLAVGEAFTVPATDATANTMSYLCNYHGKRLGRCFSRRALPEGGNEIARLPDDARSPRQYPTHAARSRTPYPAYQKR